MKALLISGSPRKDGNTCQLLGTCAGVLEANGIPTELISLAGKTMRGCTACLWCRNHQDEKRCVIQNDDFQDIFNKMVEADIIVVGSPVYFGSAVPELMALLDRAGYVGRPQNLFSRKLGGPVCVARRAGHNFTLAQLNYWFLINDMIVPGSGYWNMGVAGAAGEIQEDQEAIKTVSRFAENLAWLAQKIQAPAAE
jgi:multimeric flavodoxin WrbA